MAVSIVSLCLVTTVVLGGTYLLYETKFLPPTYEYEEALREATQAPHIAKLTIFPTTRYGGTGDHSLRKITHTLQLLSDSKTNKGLVIDLVPYGEERPLHAAYVHYTILKDALQAYKDKTKRKIIVDVPENYPISLFLLISAIAIADHIICGTTIISNTNVEEFLEQIEIALDNKIHKASKAQEKKADYLKIRERLQPHFEPIYSGDYKIENDREEEDKIWNELDSAIRDAITTLKQNYKSDKQPKEIEELIIYLQASTNDKYILAYTPEEPEAYIKRQIEQVPIIDLQPCIKDKYTPAYTPQERNAHRRTEACFETIMISGKIDHTLVRKMRPLIQSVHCDPNIKGVIIVWDSPGGFVPYAKVLLGLLKKLDAAKPVIHVTAMCASAAYLLAAGTGVKLTAYRKAQLGSIGARIEITFDKSNREKEIHKIRQWMVQRIGQNRAKILGVNQKAYEKKLWDTEARAYIATRAKEEQLIDKIGTLEDAIDELKAYTGLDLPVYYSENERHPINA